MKSYDDTMKSIFEKGDAIIGQKKKRNAKIKRITFSVSGICAALIIATGILHNNGIIENSIFESVLNGSLSEFIEETIHLKRTTSTTETQPVTTTSTTAATYKNTTQTTITSSLTTTHTSATTSSTTTTTTQPKTTIPTTKTTTTTTTKTTTTTSTSAITSSTTTSTGSTISQTTTTTTTTYNAVPLSEYYQGCINIENYIYEPTIPCALNAEYPDLSTINVYVTFYARDDSEKGFIARGVNIGTLAENIDLFDIEENFETSEEGIKDVPRATSIQGGIFEKNNIRVRLNSTTRLHFSYDVSENYSYDTSDWNHQAHELIIMPTKDEIHISKGESLNDSQIKVDIHTKHLLKDGGFVTTPETIGITAEECEFAGIDYNNLDTDTIGTYEIYLKPVNSSGKNVDVRFSAVKVIVE